VIIPEVIAEVPGATSMEASRSADLGVVAVEASTAT
jgi:hypothetical protein